MITIAVHYPFMCIYHVSIDLHYLPICVLILDFLLADSFLLCTCSGCCCLVQPSSLQLGPTSTTQVAIEMDGIMQEEYLKGSRLSTSCTRDMMKSVKCFSKSLECWANGILCFYRLWGDSGYPHIDYLGSRRLTSRTTTTTCKLHQWCYHCWSSLFVLPPHGVRPLERDTVSCLSTAQPWGTHQSASLVLWPPVCSG